MDENKTKSFMKNRSLMTNCTHFLFEELVKKNRFSFTG
jgi:hypothetical protein